ncbi:hypothetical protein GCM10028795_15140 [Lysobacter olei]
MAKCDGVMAGRFAALAMGRSQSVAMRRLPPACHWIETETGAYLRWHAGTVGWVKPTGTGAEVTIQWRDFHHTAPAASVAQGRRFLACWVAARKGFPGSVKRRC